MSIRREIGGRRLTGMMAALAGKDWGKGAWNSLVEGRRDERGLLGRTGGKIRGTGAESHRTGEI